MQLATAVLWHMASWYLSSLFLGRGSWAKLSYVEVLGVQSGLHELPGTRLGWCYDSVSALLDLLPLVSLFCLYIPTVQGSGQVCLVLGRFLKAPYYSFVWEWLMCSLEWWVTYAPWSEVRLYALVRNGHQSIDRGLALLDPFGMDDHKPYLMFWPMFSLFPSQVQPSANHVASGVPKISVISWRSASREASNGEGIRMSGYRKKVYVSSEAKL